MLSTIFNRLKRSFLLVAISCLFYFPQAIYAEETKEFEIFIENHYFTPSVIEVPSHKKFILKVINKDNEVEEFESFDLRREKIIPANGKIILRLGPLNEGEYSFVGEFHSQTAKGILIAKKEK